jgi:DNA-binding response OmpR family regulator
MLARFINLVDALARCEFLDLNLRREDGYLIVVEQRKERNLPQIFCLTSHRSPHVDLEILCMAHSFRRSN